jgi:hypothetical protein
MYALRKAQTPRGSVASASSGTDRRSASSRRRQASARAASVRASRAAAAEAFPEVGGDGGAEGARRVVEEAVARMERHLQVFEDSQYDMLLRRKRESEYRETERACAQMLAAGDLRALRCAVLLLREQKRDGMRCSQELCGAIASAVAAGGAAPFAGEGGRLAVEALAAACAESPELFDVIAGRVPRAALYAVVATAGVPSRGSAEMMMELLMGEREQSEVVRMSFVQISSHFDCSTEPIMRVARAFITGEDTIEYAFEMLASMVSASEESATRAMDCAARCFEAATSSRDQDIRAAALAAIASYLKWPACATAMINSATTRVLYLCMKAPSFSVKREALQCVRNACCTCSAKQLFMMENTGIMSQLCTWLSDKCESSALVAADALRSALMRTSFTERPCSMCVHSALVPKIHASGAFEQIIDGCKSPHVEVSQRACVILHAFFFEYCEEEKFGDQDAA